MDRGAKTCTCPTSYGAVISGICYNCTSVSNNNGPNENYNACLCISPYQWVWNSTTLSGICLCNPESEITTGITPYCLDCTALSYANGSVYKNTCDCYTNFLWNSTSLTCYCPTNLGWSFDGVSTCSCPSGSVVISGYCVDCSSSSISESTGPDVNNTVCVCTTPYQWSWTPAAGGACKCSLST